MRRVLLLVPVILLFVIGGVYWVGLGEELVTGGIEFYYSSLGDVLVKTKQEPILTNILVSADGASSWEEKGLKYAYVDGVEYIATWKWGVKAKKSWFVFRGYDTSKQSRWLIVPARGWVGWREKGESKPILVKVNDLHEYLKSGEQVNLDLLYRFKDSVPPEQVREELIAKLIDYQRKPRDEIVQSIGSFPNQVVSNVLVTGLLSFDKVTVVDPSNIYLSGIRKN
jgi:hypothetical protein